MSANDRAALPVLRTTTISATKYLTLTYRQYAKVIDASVNVQTSPDLVTWTTVTNPTIIQTGTDFHHQRSDHASSRFPPAG